MNNIPHETALENQQFNLAETRASANASEFLPFVPKRVRSYTAALLDVEDGNYMLDQLTSEQQVEFAELSLGFFRAIKSRPGRDYLNLERNILEVGLFLRGYKVSDIMKLVLPDTYEVIKDDRNKLISRKKSLLGRRPSLIRRLHAQTDYTVSNLRTIYDAFAQGQDMTQFLPKPADAPSPASEFDDSVPDISGWLRIVLEDENQPAKSDELALLQAHMMGSRVMQAEDLARTRELCTAIGAAITKASAITPEALEAKYYSDAFRRSLSYHVQEAQLLRALVGDSNGGVAPQKFKDLLADKDTTLLRSEIELAVRRLAVMRSPDIWSPRINKRPVLY